MATSVADYPDDVVVLEGVAHRFGFDETTDAIVRAATIPDTVWLMCTFDMDRGPLGKATMTRDEHILTLRGEVHKSRTHHLYGQPYLAVGVKVAGQEGEDSTLDYASVVPTAGGWGGAVGHLSLYRFTHVPAELEEADFLADYVHMTGGPLGERQEWRHCQDPLLVPHLGTIPPK